MKWRGLIVCVDAWCGGTARRTARRRRESYRPLLVGPDLCERQARVPESAGLGRGRAAPYCPLRARVADATPPPVTGGLCTVMPSSLQPPGATAEGYRSASDPASAPRL